MKLFLDDERMPTKPADYTAIVRDAQEFKQWCVIALKNNDPITYIAFDHDLGEGPSGYDCAKWMVEKDLECGGKLISDMFDFDVHSQNPVGKKNIIEFLNLYMARKI